MFERPGNYFLSLTFKWDDILNLLEMPTNERPNFVVNEKMYYKASNAYSAEGLGIDRTEALFEYYIMPKSIRNGSYAPSSTIYDQQLKRFFETPNINYGPLLNHTKHEEETVSCFFSRLSSRKGKSAFSFSYTSVRDSKALSFYFDEKYLNLDDAHKTWSGDEEISFEVVERTRNNEEIVLVEKGIFWIQICVQSQEDASPSPF